MTSVSMMEPLDETMLEYLDADIPMNSSASTSFWTTQEAIMDDESNTATLDSRSNHSETIEVDMEPHDLDQDMTEYEMADGEYAHHGEDILDVEVIDSSSPAFYSGVAVAETTFSFPHPIAAEIEHQPLSVAASFPPPIAEEHATHASELFHPEVLHSLPAVVPESVPEAHIQESIPPPSEDLVRQTIEHDQALNPYQQHHAETAAASVYRDVSFSDAKPLLASEQQRPTEFVANSAEQLDGSAGDESATAVPAKDAVDEPAALSAVIPEPASEAIAVPEEEVPVPAESDHPFDAEEHHEEGHEEDSENPLEISDGVYIDPPPAVSLNLALGSEASDFYLFNQPLPGSLPQGPSAEHAGDGASLALLLHEQPTLYYEPLTKVFEALREEELVRLSSESAEGELVLDAYDLQLAVSEDNIHASEATIHELNVLHDAAGLQGPLRLRLYALTPRFINRYYALRDQLTRLNVASEDQHQADEEHPPEEHQQEEYQGEEEHVYSVEHYEHESEVVPYEHFAEQAEDNGGENGAISESAEAGLPESEDLPGEAAQDDDVVEDHDHTHIEEALPEQPHADLQEDSNVPAVEQNEGSEPSLPVAVLDNAAPEEEAYEDSAAVPSAPDNLPGEHDVQEEQAETREDHGGDDEHGPLEEYQDDETGYENQEAGADEHENADNAALDEAAQPEDGIGGGGDDSTTDEHATEHDEDADGEYEDDAYYANEDENLQNFEEHGDYNDEQHCSSVPSEGHDEHGSEAQLDGIAPAVPEQLDEPPTEEDYGQQELLEFEDDDPVLEGTLNLKQDSETIRDVDSVSINSGKRTYDQLELEDEQDDPPSSPDSKRLRAV